MGDAGTIFVNESINNAINDYFKFKDTPTSLIFNTFSVVVARIIVLLYGELDIANCFKTMNEHGMGGFNMNICKFGYPEEELIKFKNNFQKYYELDKKNQNQAIKSKNIYMDLVQKNLIDMFFYKKVMMNLNESDTKEFYDLLFTTKSKDLYKQSYALLMSEDFDEVDYYFKLKLFRLENNYNFVLYKLNLLDMKIYNFFGLSKEVVNSFNQEQINKVNKQLFSYFSIEENDENKKEKLVTAINNTRKKPKIEIVY